jgi:chemotaxis protein methyltransferase CheR
MRQPALSDQEFTRFQRFIHDAAGITLSGSKKALVSGRLAKRVAHHGLDSFGHYLDLLGRADAAVEVQTAVDLLTTNETYFFRENKHFELLRRLALAARDERRTLRVWSAACSSGEEVYSMAMVLDDVLGGSGWELMGSDISTRVLQRAARGHYPEDRTRQIPPQYLKRYCLRGMGEQEGTMLVEKSLRQRVRFMQLNLNTALPRIGNFDVIFLRNVMIYFNADTKRQVVARVLGQLVPGGHFCIGHSETLNDISNAVHQLVPSVYQKP